MSGRARLATTMHACPPIDIPPHTTSSEFWEQFGESPAPRVIRGSAPADFWSEFGVSDPSSGGTYFGDVGLLSGSGRGGTPYTLTNPGYTPGIFRDLPSRFPIPDILAAINLRPVLSLGLNGTGERDIAHHYHPVTVMRLLQGRKIWALRPPGDQECMRNTGSCTDPLNVCEFYAMSDAPAPACIQEAGDTIIVPDGWYHGTCNNASVTVGWGAQGRSLPLQPPSCFHCSLRGGSRGQLQYATTTTELPQLSLSEHRALNDVLAGGAARHLPPSQDGIGSNFLYLGPVHQSIYMGFRSLLHQFVVQTDLEAEQNADLRAPDCRLLTGAAAALRDGRAATTVSWLRSAAHVAFYVNVRGKPISLRWRHRSSGELEERILEPRHCAVWLGDALDEKLHEGTSSVPASSAQAAIVCRALLPRR